MKNLAHLFLILSVSIILISCDSSTESNDQFEPIVVEEFIEDTEEVTDSPSQVSRLLYFNSFESEEDLIGFEGNAYQLSDETVTDGGSKSLLVCGGCVGPHAYWKVGPFDQDLELNIEFFAMTDVPNGAMITFSEDNNYENSSTFILDSEDWKRYETEENFVLPEGQKLLIEIISGGFVPVTSIFDLLSIHNANQQ